MLILRCLVAVLVFCFVQGATLTVNWTLQGVQTYTDKSTPLQTNLGDMLVLKCDGFSNLFIQTNPSQYDSCNASAGSGMYAFNGFCFNGSEITLTLTENSQNLMNTVNFENNRMYYFTSYSTGIASGANDQSMNYGGQCLDGLKMVVRIGQVVSSTAATEGINPSSTNPNEMNIIIIAASVGGGSVVILIAVIVFVLACCCCLKKKRNLQKVDEGNKSESGELKSGADDKPEPNGDSKPFKSKPDGDSKVKPDADGKPKFGANSKSKPGANSKCKPSGDGKPKFRADDKVKLGGDGKPKPGPDGKVKHGADGKPKPDGDGKPKVGANDKSKPSGDSKSKYGHKGGPKPTPNKSDCESELKPSPKSGPRLGHENKFKSSVRQDSDKVNASSRQNKKIQLLSVKKVTETPQPQDTAGRPETFTKAMSSWTGNEVDSAGKEVHKSIRKPARLPPPPPPGGRQKPRTGTANCEPSENGTGACNGGSANAAKQPKNGTANNVHSNAARVPKTSTESPNVKETSKGSRSSTRVTGASMNGSASSKDIVHTTELPKKNRSNAGPSKSSTVHSRSGTEHEQRMNGNRAFNNRDMGDKNKSTGSARVVYRAQEENINIPNQTD